MIRSSASLMAEDVTVRCRVRTYNLTKSMNSTMNYFNDEGSEMTVTMRNWQSHNHKNNSINNGTSSRRSRSRILYYDEKKNDNNSDSNSENWNNNGPELLLTRVEEFLSNRDDSPVRRRTSLSKVAPIIAHNHNQQQQQQKQYSIPIDNILIVDTSKNGNYTKLHLTTMSMGNFEFYNLTTNGYDILLAFLKASLSSERILEGLNNNKTEYYNQNNTNNLRSSSSSVTSCLDIDTLQAKHLEGRAAAETWPEKLSRRVGHVFHNLTELSEAFCDVSTTCCSTFNNNNASATTTERREDCNDIRSSHKLFAELEIDDNTTVESSPSLRQNIIRRKYQEEKKQEQRERNSATTTAAAVQTR